MLVEPFSCNREEDPFSIRKPMRQSVTILLVRFVRNRQYLWVSAVGRDSEEPRVPAGCHHNRTVWAPAGSKTLGLTANHRGNAAIDGNLHELAVGPETDPTVIGRQEWSDSVLCSRDGLSLQMIDLPKIKLTFVSGSQTLVNGGIHNEAAIARNGHCGVVGLVQSEGRP